MPEADKDALGEVIARLLSAGWRYARSCRMGYAASLTV